MKKETKKMIDRMMSVILALTMIFCLIGCGNTAPAIGEDVVVGNTEENGETIVGSNEEDDTKGAKEETESNDGEVAGASGEEEPAVTASPLPTTEPTPTPTAEPTPTPEPHTHDYAETVTKQPSCSEAGEKTLICSCGDSKTETVPPTGQHNWVEEMQTVTYPSTGHVENVRTQVGTSETRHEYGCANCGARFDSPEAKVEHCKATGDFNHATSRTIIYDIPGEPIYEETPQWVVDTPERTETVGTGRFTCSVCGATK